MGALYRRSLAKQFRDRQDGERVRQENFRLLVAPGFCTNAQRPEKTEQSDRYLRQ